MNGASPNIYDVARQAGVSKSTVSRVLTSNGRVSASTRLRVEQAMAALGYSPNTSARRLAGSGDKRIGLLLPYFGDMFSSFYVHEILRGVGEVASSRDAEMLVHVQHSASVPRDVERKLRQNGLVGGWLIADDSVPGATLGHLRRSGVPYVLLNRATLSEGDMNTAGVDNRLGARLAVKYLMSLGHRRIATLTGALSQEPGRERLAGYRETMEQAGLAVPREYVAEANFSRSLARDAVARMLRFDYPPTAIFAASDQMAAGAQEAALESGLRLPVDLSIIGFDDEFLACQLAPRLTTIRQPIRDVCALAAAWLLENMDRPGAPPVRIVLKPELVVRDSCGRPAAVAPERMAAGVA